MRIARFAAIVVALFVIAGCGVDQGDRPMDSYTYDSVDSYPPDYPSYSYAPPADSYEPPSDTYEPQPPEIPDDVPPETEPEPEPDDTSSDCDPNYSGCVPVASDVDCASGSGNGPAYVDGPVSVVGEDIYGLDRDGDGIGCDS